MGVGKINVLKAKCRYCNEVIYYDTEDGYWDSVAKWKGENGAKYMAPVCPILNILEGEVLFHYPETKAQLWVKFHKNAK